MNRRNFVASSVAVAGTALAGNVVAEAHKSYKKKHKMKHKMMDTKFPTTLNRSKQKGIINATHDCIDKGRICLTHCAKELSTGSPMMAKCNIAVQNMLAACEGLHKIVHLNTLDKSTLKSFVVGCRKICEDCAAECKKHAGHHEICKECMVSCNDFLRASKDIV